MRYKDELIVYTAILGAYDKLKPVLSKNIPHICLTDQIIPESLGWKIQYLASPTTIDERIRLVRHVKLHPQLYLPNHSYSIWIDASLRPKKKLATAADYLRNFDIGAYAYPPTYGFRDCAYQEAEACILRRKDKPEIIKEQIARYHSEGYPEHFGLVETSLLVRANCKTSRTFCERWWSEIQRGSRRDQLSFNYVSWVTGICYDIIPGQRTSSDFAEWSPHLEDVYQ